MNRTWKVVAVASALWGTVLVVVVTLLLAPWVGDGHHHVGHGAYAGGGTYAGGGMHAGGGMVANHGMTAVSEYDYLAEMVSHHREAIVAAEELRRSEEPRMRELGDDIVTSQTAQVILMEGWLDEWYPDRTPYDPDYRPMMRDLSDLSGEALDRAFLVDMLPHHMMAVMRSQHLLLSSAAEHPEVARLAATIRDEQHAEIALMRRLLSRSSRW